MPAVPFIPKNPNDLIRAADWNQIQIDGRDEVRAHDHSGGDQGVQLGTAAIADGAITAAKLDPNLELGGGGTPDDDSVTTVKIVDAAVTSTKLANASVTTAKLAQPLGALSCSALDLGGIPVRPVFDEVHLDWSWQIDGAPINLEQPSSDPLGGAFEQALEIISNMEDPVRRALLILSRTLDPSLLASQNAEDVFGKLPNPSLESTLDRAGLSGDDVEAALGSIDGLWETYLAKKTPYPNLLFALSTMPAEALEKLEQAMLDGIPNGSAQDLLNAVLSTQSLSNYSESLSSAMIRPLGTIHPETGRASPPLIELDPVSGFQISELEVEVTATLRGSGFAIIGVGGAQTPPALGSWVMLGQLEGQWSQRIRLVRRFTVLDEQVRQLRLWGIAIQQPFYDSSVILLDAQMRARRIGLSPNYAEKPSQSTDPDALDPELANVSAAPIPPPTPNPDNNNPLDNNNNNPLDPLDPLDNNNNPLDPLDNNNNNLLDPLNS